jgi:glycosyltransferase involved in cell wall biosynthesis
MSDNAPRVSIVIPAYNEATYIGRLLEALCRQSFKDFEVIVSDAQSNDGTEEVVSSFKDRLNIRFVESPPLGPGHGRNIGAKLAIGQWLLFLDADDDLDDRDFITGLLEAAKERRWQTLSTNMKVRGARLRSRIGLRINYFYWKLLAHTKHPVAPGYCILTRRSVFEENHGFNEKVHFGEDFDYVSRVAKNGFGFVDDLYYYWDPRRSREEGLRYGLKYIVNEFYRHLHRYNLEKSHINYEFGKHQERHD